MAKKEGAKTVGDVKPPRAHVEFEVWKDGASQLLELPFVIGAMADLSGKPKTPLEPVGKRKFEEVGESGLAPLFNKYRPRVAFPVQNKLAEGGDDISVDIEFRSMDDFSPAAIAKRVKPTKELLEKRERLAYLLANLDGKDNAEELVADILKKAEALGSGGQ